MLSSLPARALAADFVVNATFPTYTINGVANPPLTVVRGQTYTFDVNATNHPFYIKSVQSNGTGNAYNNGVSVNGVQSGTITWTVPSDAPSQLFYDCAIHLVMSGPINVTGPVPAQGSFTVALLAIVLAATGAIVVAKRRGYRVRPAAARRPA
jgi:hypothetical protein